LQFWIKKDKKKHIQLYFFSSGFGHQNPGSGLDLAPDSLLMLDPQLCFL
jgi:hypothetical protein